MEPCEIAVSAPGKVLLAGGYLVLDRNYTGLVFALNARIHVHVRPSQVSPCTSRLNITVRSAQFLDSQWRYKYEIAEDSRSVRVLRPTKPTQDQVDQNHFVEVTLNYTITYILALNLLDLHSIDITVLADDGFYTQNVTCQSKSNGFSSDQFSAFSVPLWKANKTGIGSSAALVTALVAALLAYYLPSERFNLSCDSGKRTVHNLAQAAHCAAQGKVGSGFDVAAAVYGSCSYRRFSPQVLESCGQFDSPAFSQQLRSLVDDGGETSKWDMEIAKEAIGIPKQLRLIMCDVDCGSQTPNMLKRALAWRNEQPSVANAIWTALQGLHDKLANELKRLSEANQNKDYSRLKGILGSARALIRQMTAASGIPIEPPEQTALLDACSQLDGVIGGIVPGAGGYDAIVLLVENRQDVIDKLKELLSKWEVPVRDRVESQIGEVKMLDVCEGLTGLQEECVGKYACWVKHT